MRATSGSHYRRGALADAIHAGATDQPHRGRIDAFALELGFGLQWAPQERPIALDLAAALLRLEGTTLQQVITQVCQVDEPILLAGIVANTPSSIHEQVKARLLTLSTISPIRRYSAALGCKWSPESYSALNRFPSTGSRRTASKSMIASNSFVPRIQSLILARAFCLCSCIETRYTRRVGLVHGST
jgi:hypothetical protein